MGFRSFLEMLEKSGELTRIRKAVSTEYETAGVIEALGEKPVFFENIKESDIPVVGGLLSSRINWQSFEPEKEASATQIVQCY